MLLAAGLGTRLAPLTHHLPKPLVWIGDEPAIARTARTLAAAGFERAVTNVCHLARCWDDAVLARIPLSLELVRENAVLGTAGGLANAAPLLGEGDVLLWNADVLADVDVKALLRAHRAATRPGVLATWLCAHRSDSRGTLGLDDDGFVVRLRGQAFGRETRSADFLGVQVWSPEGRALAPREGCLVGDVALPALAAGARLATAAHEGGFTDIGSVPAYLEANRAWLAERGLDSFASPLARVGPRVTLRRSVVLDHGTITGEGLIEDCVVWPGATLVAPARGEVALPPLGGHAAKSP
jgi:mannose-1-phosphate guanylyltransferase